MEEPQIEPGKIEKFKVILEGGKFDTNVKFKNKAKVSGVPVIITTNEEIWRFAPAAAAPFASRIYRWDFKNPISFKIPGPFHPKMWYNLGNDYDLWKCVDIESSTDEEGEPIFGTSVNKRVFVASSEPCTPEKKRTRLVEDTLDISMIEFDIPSVAVPTPAQLHHAMEDFDDLIQIPLPPDPTIEEGDWELGVRFIRACNKCQKRVALQGEEDYMLHRCMKDEWLTWEDLNFAAENGEIENLRVDGKKWMVLDSGATKWKSVKTTIEEIERINVQANITDFDEDSIMPLFYLL